MRFKVTKIAFIIFFFQKCNFLESFITAVTWLGGCIWAWNLATSSFSFEVADLTLGGNDLMWVILWLILSVVRVTLPGIRLVHRFGDVQRSQSQDPVVFRDLGLNGFSILCFWGLLGSKILRENRNAWKERYWDTT